MQSRLEVDKTSYNSRVPALDGIRGLAILLVTLYRFADPAFPESLVGKQLHQATFLGATGVDLFFVLSGFLITGVLIDSRNSVNYFRRFYFRRALRIFPLYYVSLFFFLVFLPFGLGNRTVLDDIEANPIHLWTYTSNLVMAWTNSFGFGSLDHFWSLAIEEQFYLVWPIVVLFIAPQRLAKVALILALLFVTARVGCSVWNIGEVTERMFTLFRCEGLLMGAIAAVFVRQNPDFTRYRNAFRVAFIVASILFMILLPLGSKDFTIRYTVVSLVWVSLLLCVISSKVETFERRIFEATPLRVLGKYSYAMYIFQTPLIPLLAAVISPAILASALRNPLLGGLVFVICMFGITLAIAMLSWHCLEKWCLKLRD